MDLVREHDISFEDFKKYLFHEESSLPEGYVGSLGYPSFATKDKGRKIIDRMIDKMIEECYNFLQPTHSSP